MMNKVSNGQSDYIYGIDLLRFFSAAFVMLFHLGFASWASPLADHPGFKIDTLQRLAQPGWVGVEIFFVISGFVVSGAASVATPFAFLRGRMLRLYPAVWICATATLVILLSNGESIRCLYRYSMSMLLFPKGPWIDGQYWTLATEISFYSMIFILISSRAMAWIGVFATTLAILSAVLLVVLLIFPTSKSLVHVAYLPYIPIFNGADFALGIFIWLWSKGRLNFLTRSGVAIAIGAGCLQIYEGNVYDNSRTFAATGAHFPTWVPMAIWLIASALIALSVGLKHSFDGLPQFALSTIRTLGQMTYPLYLLHFTIGVVGMSVMIQRGVRPITSMTIMMIVICGIALAISSRLEPLLKNRFRRFIDKVATRKGYT